MSSACLLSGSVLCAASGGGGAGGGVGCVKSENGAGGGHDRCIERGGVCVHAEGGVLAGILLNTT